MARRVPIAQRGPGQSYRPDQRPPSIFGAHQPGIATPLLDHLVFAAFDVADRDPRDLLIEWSARAERLMRVHDALTLTIGWDPGSSMSAPACAMPARWRSRSCRRSPATSSIPPDAAAICASRRPRTIRGARREQSRS
jgi:hypothetical protein